MNGFQPDRNGKKAEQQHTGQSEQEHEWQGDFFPQHMGCLVSITVGKNQYPSDKKGESDKGETGSILRRPEQSGARDRHPEDNIRIRIVPDPQDLVPCIP
ncbi:MAG TPA: hypothetical protein VLO11_09840 [Luteolibacter sp.]|nr:hypothetical protein [Luteolibacter sp.]